jgi:hypothetical protein
MRHYEPPFRMKDYIKFLEWQEKREEALSKKKEEAAKKKEIRREGRAFTFAEGMILAFVAQFLLGPLYNHYLATLGIH